MMSQATGAALRQQRHLPWTVGLDRDVGDRDLVDEVGEPEVIGTKQGHTQRPGVGDELSTLRGDLIELASQQLRLYLGPEGRAALRISLDALDIPDIAAQAEALSRARVLAARKIVRRGVARGDVAKDTSVTLLLDTLCGGAMMHVGVTPPELREQLITGVDRYARQLVDFLLASITAGKRAEVAPADRTR
jgi:hypothetical protein